MFYTQNQVDLGAPGFAKTSQLTFFIISGRTLPVSEISLICQLFLKTVHQPRLKGLSFPTQKDLLTLCWPVFSSQEVAGDRVVVCDCNPCQVTEEVIPLTVLGHCGRLQNSFFLRLSEELCMEACWLFSVTQDTKAWWNNCYHSHSGIAVNIESRIRGYDSPPDFGFGECPRLLCLQLPARSPSVLLEPCWYTLGLLFSHTQKSSANSNLQFISESYCTPTA